MAGHSMRRRAAPRGAHAPRVKSFRLSRLGFPRAELRRVVAGAVCKRIIAHWLTAAPVDSAEAEAERLHAHLELEEAKFFEIVSERAARALGADPRNLAQRAADELQKPRGRDNADQVIRQFFDQMDRLIGDQTTNAAIAAADLEAKLQLEFKCEGTNRQQQLETWLKAIVENPTQRLKLAGDAEAAMTRRLIAAAEETQAKITCIRSQRIEIRKRSLGSGSQRLVSNLLKNLRTENVVQSADRLREYGQLCLSEIALRVRAEVLDGLQRKAAQWLLEFDRIRHGLTDVAQRLHVHVPRSRNSAHAALGSSVEILPLAAVECTEVANPLAESFCSERWLDAFGRRFQEEVLEPHGGLTVVMQREPRSIGEWFRTTLLDRVADAVGLWLEDMDAASLLMRQYGSAHEVENELSKCLKSAAFRAAERDSPRIVVGTPGSPSGRQPPRTARGIEHIRRRRLRHDPGRRRRVSRTGGSLPQLGSPGPRVEELPARGPGQQTDDAGRCELDPVNSVGSSHRWEKTDPCGEGEVAAG